MGASVSAMSSAAALAAFDSLPPKGMSCITGCTRALTTAPMGRMVGEKARADAAQRESIGTRSARARYR